MVFSFASQVLSRLSLHNHIAFSGLYHLHTKALFHLALQLTAGDRAAACEIVQQTWIAACENLAQYTRGPMRKWLVSILVKCSRKYYHLHRNYMLIDNNFNEFLASRLLTVNNNGNAMDFEEALGLLPVGYRHVLMLHDSYSYNHRSIGELIQISEGASANLLFKARKALWQLSAIKNTSKATPYFGWSESEMKKLRASFSDIALPKELREQVMDQLYQKGLIVNNNPGHTFIKSIEQALRLRSFLLQR